MWYFMKDFPGCRAGFLVHIIPGMRLDHKGLKAAKSAENTHFSICRRTAKFILPLLADRLPLPPSLPSFMPIIPGDTCLQKGTLM